MPVVYASIGTYQGFPRIEKFKGISFHAKHGVAKIPAGQIGQSYVDTVSGYLKRVEAEERGDLERAASWSADAKKQGKRLIMYSMGHLFPAEIAETEIGRMFESANWNSGFFAAAVPNHDYGPGDVCIHIGYQHPPYRLLERAVPAGARVAYVDVMAHRDYVKNPNVIAIDPMWPWVDGCVPLEGYDVPLLAGSGVVNGAIAWELARLTAAASK